MSVITPQNVNIPLTNIYCFYVLERGVKPLILAESLRQNYKPLKVAHLQRNAIA